MAYVLSDNERIQTVLLMCKPIYFNRGYLAACTSTTGQQFVLFSLKPLQLQHYKRIHVLQKTERVFFVLRLETRQSPPFETHSLTEASPSNSLNRLLFGCMELCASPEPAPFRPTAVPSPLLSFFVNDIARGRVASAEVHAEFKQAFLQYLAPPKIGKSFRWLDQAVRAVRFLGQLLVCMFPANRSLYDKFRAAAKRASDAFVFRTYFLPVFEELFSGEIQLRKSLTAAILETCRRLAVPVAADRHSLQQQIDYIRRLHPEAHRLLLSLGAIRKTAVGRTMSGAQIERVLERYLEGRGSVRDLLLRAVHSSQSEARQKKLLGVAYSEFLLPMFGTSSQSAHAPHQARFQIVKILLQSGAHPDDVLKIMRHTLRDHLAVTDVKNQIKRYMQPKRVDRFPKFVFDLNYGDFSPSKLDVIGKIFVSHCRQDLGLCVVTPSEEKPVFVDRDQPLPPWLDGVASPAEPRRNKKEHCCLFTKQETYSVASLKRAQKAFADQTTNAAKYRQRFIRDVLREASVEGDRAVLTRDYYKTTRLGRVYCRRPCLQGCPSDLRDMLVQGKSDIDLSNSHPRLLLDVANRNGIPVPTLRRYVTQRAGEIEDMKRYYGQCSTADIKRCVLRIINLGHIDGWVTEIRETRPDVADAIQKTRATRGEHRTLSGIQSDIQGKLMQAVIDTYPDAADVLREKQNENPSQAYSHKSLFSWCLHNIEYECLQKIEQCLATHIGDCVEAYVHDAVWVRTDQPIGEKVLRACEQYVKSELGWNISLGENHYRKQTC